MLLARTEAGLMGRPCDRHPPSSIPISRTKSLMDYQRGDLHDYRQYIQYQSLSIRSDQNVPEAKKHEAFQSAESYVQILPGQSTRKVHKSLLQYKGRKYSATPKVLSSEKCVHFTPQNLFVRLEISNCHKICPTITIRKPFWMGINFRVSNANTPARFLCL